MSLSNGVLFVLAWVAWVACLRGWHAGVGGMLAWVAWVVRLHGWRTSMGGMGGMLA